MAARRCSRLPKRLLAWLTRDEPRTRGMIVSSHQDLIGALQGDQGPSSHRLCTLEARGLLVIVRSRGGKAEALSLTSAGQKWARQCAGSWDEGAGRQPTRGRATLPPPLRGRRAPGVRPRVQPCSS
jgi:hypothetical protein